MVKCECIYKHRNNSGKIVKYLISNREGVITEFTPEQLKTEIANGALSVTNLTLTSNGRLIEREDKTIKLEKVEEQIEKAAARLANELNKHNEYALRILLSEHTMQEFTDDDTKNKVIKARNKILSDIKELYGRDLNRLSFMHLNDNLVYGILTRTGNNIEKGREAIEAINKITDEVTKLTKYCQDYRDNEYKSIKKHNMAWKNIFGAIAAKISHEYNISLENYRLDSINRGEIQFAIISKNTYLGVGNYTVVSPTYNSKEHKIKIMRHKSYDIVAEMEVNQTKMNLDDIYSFITNTIRKDSKADK